MNMITRWRGALFRKQALELSLADNATAKQHSAEEEAQLLAAIQASLEDPLLADAADSGDVYADLDEAASTQADGDAKADPYEFHASDGEGPGGAAGVVTAAGAQRDA